MAISKRKAAANARKYYKEHPAYRREKIEDRKEYRERNRQSDNAYAREYYRTHSKYRKYKIQYAKSYRKAHK